MNCSSKRESTKMTVLYLEVRFLLVKGRQIITFLCIIVNKVNGRAFSKMKLVHIEQMGVSFGSRIIIETLLEDIVSSMWSKLSKKECFDSKKCFDSCECNTLLVVLHITAC